MRNLATIISPGRRCGNTTRQIDKEIQSLFQTGECCYCDHYQLGRYKEANEHHLRRILRRLELEHHLTTKDMIIDRGKHTITLDEYPKDKWHKNLREIIDFLKEDGKKQ